MKLCLECGKPFNLVDWQCPLCQFLPEIQEDFMSFSPALAKISSGFKPEFFQELAAIEEKNFWFIVRNQLIMWALRYYFPAAENFFEIGCGTGFVLSGIQKNFPQMKLFGSEIYIEGLQHAAKRLERISLCQMDARCIPFVDEFDVMGAFDVLEHVEEDEEVLLQMYRAIRPGGGVILTVPQHKFLWSQQDEYACHVRRYSAKELQAKVTAAGFKVIRSTSFVSLLLPALLLSRFTKRKPDSEFDALKELKLSQPLNTLFRKILELEQKFIRFGFNFPMGGSLLLIAKKLTG
jgi:SAM-dependent methyltransferase